MTTNDFPFCTMLPGNLGSAVSNVVLRIVGQSVACASLGH